MTEVSEKSIKSLITLFEKKIELGSQQRATKDTVLHRISQQQKQNLLNLLFRKRSSNPNWYVVQRSITPKESLALQQQRSHASVDSSRRSSVMPTGELATRKHLKERNQEKELEEASQMSQKGNVRSKINMLTKPSQVTVARFNSKHEMQHQESVDNKQLEEIAKLVQSIYLSIREVRAAREESAKERQMRIETERRLKQANINSLVLVKKLEEIKEDLMRHKADHMKTQEELKTQAQLNLYLSRQLSKANDKAFTLIQRLEAIASNANGENKSSAANLTPSKQRNDSELRVDHERTLSQFRNDSKSKIDKEMTQSKQRNYSKLRLDHELTLSQFRNDSKSKIDKEITHSKQRNDYKLKIDKEMTQSKQRNDSKLKIDPEMTLSKQTNDSKYKIDPEIILSKNKKESRSKTGQERSHSQQTTTNSIDKEMTISKQTSDSRPRIDQEVDENKIKLSKTLTDTTSNHSMLDDAKEEEEVEGIKTTPEETKLEWKTKKSASHNGKDQSASLPVFSHSFSMSELTKACNPPIPNLRFGLDRPKRIKNHALSCTWTRAQKVDI